MDDTRLLKFYIHNLTPRQREVVYYTAKGLSNADIAQELFVQPSVVAEHLTNIYEEIATLDNFKSRPTRFTLISLFTGFFQRNPDLLE